MTTRSYLISGLLKAIILPVYHGVRYLIGLALNISFSHSRQALRNATDKANPSTFSGCIVTCAEHISKILKGQGPGQPKIAWSSTWIKVQTIANCPKKGQNPSIDIQGHYFHNNSK